MLKDEVRTKSYRSSIFNNKHLFRGKVVLDVGCGTGILCMFAAEAGAKMVFGIECSEIINQAREIVKLNGFENVITLIKGRLEEVELPVPKVDIIISEWMGYFLFYESMLDTVLFARDKWLAPGGMLFPDKATLYIAAIEDEKYKRDKIDFWDDVYGFDMGGIKDIAYGEPLVDVVEHRALASTVCPLISVDIQTVTKPELSFSKPFTLTATRDDDIHALVAYFDIYFTKCHKLISFSTGPRARYTHWKQTVFYLRPTLSLRKGEKITGTLTCTPNSRNPRDLDIEISYTCRGSQCNISGTQKYWLR